MALSIVELVAEIDALLPDNTSRSITPEAVRTVCTDIAEFADVTAVAQETDHNDFSGQLDAHEALLVATEGMKPEIAGGSIAGYLAALEARVRALEVEGGADPYEAEHTLEVNPEYPNGPLSSVLVPTILTTGLESPEIDLMDEDPHIIQVAFASGFDRTDLLAIWDAPIWAVPAGEYPIVQIKTAQLAPVTVAALDLWISDSAFVSVQKADPADDFLTLVSVNYG